MCKGVKTEPEKKTNEDLMKLKHSHVQSHILGHHVLFLVCFDACSVLPLYIHESNHIRVSMS